LTLISTVQRSENKSATRLQNEFGIESRFGRLSDLNDRLSGHIFPVAELVEATTRSRYQYKKLSKFALKNKICQT